MLVDINIGDGVELCDGILKKAAIFGIVARDLQYSLVDTSSAGSFLLSRERT